MIFNDDLPIFLRVRRIHTYFVEKLLYILDIFSHKDFPNLLKFLFIWNNLNFQNILGLDLLMNMPYVEMA